MDEGLRIGIAGAGSIAFGTAALLAENGHDPMLWSPSGRGTEALAEGAALIAEGAIEAALTPRIATTARQLAEENNCLLFALPAYGHKTVMDALAPHIQGGQHVIISSHASLGAVYLGHLLAARGVSAPITAWGTTAVTGRRQSPTRVRVNTVRKLIDLCTVPEAYSDEALALCQRLFGDRFQPRDGLLAISLSNLNPQNHMGIALGNMTRMERGEDWSQGQNVTPNVGRLLEALDAERLAIADALGLKVRTIFEHFHLSFHVPVASISEMNQAMHADGNGGTGPATADSRYVTEDVPYGLALTAALGRMVERPALLHEAGIRIFSAMYGRDFQAENTLLDAIDLSSHGLDGLKEAAKSGLLARPEATVAS
jgi:opine dehydrogenase